MVVSTYQYFVGIDIAAQTAEVVVHSALGEVLSVLSIEQTPEQYQRVHDALTKLKLVPEQCLVEMEATGMY